MVKEKLIEEPELNWEQKQAIENKDINPALRKCYEKEGRIKQTEKTVKQIQEEEKQKENLLEAYKNIIEILKKYCDIKEEYYPLLAVWIIGTHFHHDFESYPYLFVNAMKGSGKTRLLKLIAILSKDGEILTSLSEAVLFRTKGTLCIDEFEGLNRAGGENLRELLNASYKKGTKVKRMRKARGADGESQVVEEFDVYRPIAMANIWGMENVLGDRCISVVLERSNNEKVTKLLEIFNHDNLITLTKSLFTKGRCSLCSVVATVDIHLSWNEYITGIYTTTYYNNYTLLHTLFEDIKNSKINGRDLELSMPLLLIAHQMGNEVFQQIISTLMQIMEDKKTEEFTESRDVLLIDFVSQQLDDGYYKSLTNITKEFESFLQLNEDWINTRWVGRALKRLNLIKKKRRISRGVEAVLDIPKAQEKIMMFK